MAAKTGLSGTCNYATGTRRLSQCMRYQTPDFLRDRGGPAEGAEGAIRRGNQLEWVDDSRRTILLRISISVGSSTNEATVFAQCPSDGVHGIPDRRLNRAGSHPTHRWGGSARLW